MDTNAQDSSTRTTGHIFNILVDWTVERVKGGRMDRCNVRVCRYNSNDADDRDWTSRGYPRNGRQITKATMCRLKKYAPLAIANRKLLVSAVDVVRMRMDDAIAEMA